MASNEWELICKQCGKCCYHLIRQEGGTISRSPNLHCKHHNPIDHTCIVYKDRFQVAYNCRELFEAMLPSCLNGFLPEDCGYIEYYRSKHEFDTRTI